MSETGYFIENCMHGPWFNMGRSNTFDKIFTSYIENAKLRCCWSKFITKLKIICDEEPLISLQNVKKATKECSFWRNYRVATCSLTKNKTPSRRFFMVGNKISGSLWRNTLQLLVAICLLLTSMIFVAITLYRWGVFMVFRRKWISYGPYSTRWYHFLNSFS